MVTNVHIAVRPSFTRRRLLSSSLGVVAGFAGGSTLTREPTPAIATQVQERGGPDRVASLLELIPAALYGPASTQGWLFSYADLRYQLEASGVAPFEPGSEELPDGYREATRVLALTATPYQFANHPDLIEVLGFSPYQAEESLVIGEVPNDQTVFRGGLNIESLPQAWETSGYIRETGPGGVPIWTIGKEGEFDPETPPGAFGVGSLNNVVILNSDTLVFGRFFADIEAIVRQAIDPGPSYLEASGLEKVLAALAPDTVSAIGVDGSYLDVRSGLQAHLSGQLTRRGYDAEALLAESDVETGVVPAIGAAIFAITAGASGTPLAEDVTASPWAGVDSAPATGDGSIIQVRLDADSGERASTVVAAVEHRWNTWSTLSDADVRFTDLMTIVSAAPDGEIAAVDFRAVQSAEVWLTMLLYGDLLPFAWDSEALGDN